MIVIIAAACISTAEGIKCGSFMPPVIFDSRPECLAAVDPVAEKLRFDAAGNPVIWMDIRCEVVAGAGA